ncbi:hypothetical protein MA16_Dca009937 [Dendrobium catenatum]|uniref:Uncharacterized protein n=1 Tax=Dendrobium catenatum TaxID=906689 RepID=A0A2I0WD99_9ASPA|nr:hypothetical protein MA16_Dca009937 [Dendrobium catenatum]
MLEQIRTELLGVPKFLFSSILGKKTTLAFTNTGNDKSTTLKILIGDLFKAKKRTSKSRKISPVNKKKGSQHPDDEVPHDIQIIPPPDPQHLRKRTEDVYKYSKNTPVRAP